MSHRGATLPELMLAVGIIVLLSAIAVPRMLHVADAAIVREEAARMVGALDAARGAAIRLGTRAELSITPAEWCVVVARGPDTLIAWHAAGSAAHGVTITGSGAPIAFGRSGVATGVANRTITISRGAASRRLVVSRLGRLLVI